MIGPYKRNKHIGLTTQRVNPKVSLRYIFLVVL